MWSLQKERGEGRLPLKGARKPHKSFELLVWLLLTPVPFTRLFHSLANIRPQFLLSVRSDLLGISFN